jgi:hypothetical protein
MEEEKRVEGIMSNQKLLEILEIIMLVFNLPTNKLPINIPIVVHPLMLVENLDTS